MTIEDQVGNTIISCVRIVSGIPYITFTDSIDKENQPTFSPNEWKAAKEMVDKMLKMVEM